MLHQPVSTGGQAARLPLAASVWEGGSQPNRFVKQALSIMENFRQNGHIDPDLFEVFLQQGVHRRYGEAFLGEGQVDC